ncbi:MAG: hypothetical protein CMM84_03740 [Rhodothermaceae bacterium]|nr:hypothetical protein [Rhodothermaceae bacterium]MBC15329.1 hypothetical protein [Rhodothermaceae bacterium]
MEPGEERGRGHPSGAGGGGLLGLSVEGGEGGKQNDRLVAVEVERGGAEAALPDQERVLGY